MGLDSSQSVHNARKASDFRRVYELLGPRAYSVLMFAALFCTLTVKFFHAHRNDLFNDYCRWILADISVLMVIEVILALVCFRWPRKSFYRTATIIAGVLFTWSIVNAGWLIRTGTQILPRVLLPLFRDPLNALLMVGVNIVEMPLASTLLFGPCVVALGFLFCVLARPRLAPYKRRQFFARIVVCLIVVVGATVIRSLLGRHSSPDIASVGLCYNAQLRSVISLIMFDYKWLDEPRREIPSFDRVRITPGPQWANHSVVIVILEGVQYVHTSLADRQNKLTPYLVSLAEQGVEFANTRTSLSHTTKVVFALLTGRFPSASQDLAEAVPAAKPYAGLVTILKEQLGFRTAFFQSAKGDFEARPGLVSNLGFEKFWAREDLGDTESFIAYLACDEFSMLEPITEWIKADQGPFLLTVLCSVTHDPYEVPEWFGEPAKEPVERYRQTIAYTDKFLEALDVELARLNLADRIIYCVVGDHGEAFGEHGLMGHERIAFDEALRVPFCLRAPLLVKPGTKVTNPVGSIDLTPTLLALLGFDISRVGFDGVDVLSYIPSERKVYFSGWMEEGPAGFVEGNSKFIYNPADQAVCHYNLSQDPGESARIELPEEQARRVADNITNWRKNSVFRIHQQRTGRTMLFEHWFCRWTGRICRAKYRPGGEGPVPGYLLWILLFAAIGGPILFWRLLLKASNKKKG